MKVQSTMTIDKWIAAASDDAEALRDRMTAFSLAAMGYPDCSSLDSRLYKSRSSTLVGQNVAKQVQKRPSTLSSPQQTVLGPLSPEDLRYARYIWQPYESA